MRVDSHQHFWRYTEQEYDWIGEEEQVIRRDFLPADLAPILKSADIDKCVAVQARQTEEETQWLLSLAEGNDLIAGVVGWIDIKASNLSDQIAAYANRNKLKGFRHVLQGEADPEFMLAPTFVRGLQTLAEHNLTYDLLIFAKQLPQSIELVKQLPNLSIVVDHIAKPDIVNHSDFDAWKAGMEKLASFENVMCKVSGLVTEADVNNWQIDDFKQYLDVVFKAFGPNRIMFGSDWPVCLLGGDYLEIKNIVDRYVNQYYAEYTDEIYGGNAAKFYQL